jgi:hypothetical protein
MPAVLVRASAFSQIRLAALASRKKEKRASSHSLTAVEVEYAPYLRIKKSFFILFHIVIKLLE